MKKIFFSLFLVLGLCLSTYSHAVKNVAVYHTENVGHKQLLVSNTTQVETRSSFAALIEEDNDDICVEKEGFFPRISVITSTYLSASHLNENCFKSDTLSRYLSNPTQSVYSNFRVLRI